jgi:hypothetical protein
LLKAANPKISVILYLNSVMLFPFYSLATRFWFDAPTDSLLLHNADGSLGTIQNDAGLGNLTVPNWGLPTARNVMLNEIRNYTSGGAFDGIFSDKAVKDSSNGQICNHGCINLTHTDAVAWSAGHRQLMQDAQILLGGGVNMRKAGSLNGNDGPNVSTYTEFSATLDNVQKLGELRKQVTGDVFAYAGKHCDDSIVAAYLIGLEPRVFLQCEDWLEEFGFPLGEPNGAASAKGQVYTRAFASGTVATFDAKENKGSVKWASRVALL